MWIEVADLLATRKTTFRSRFSSCEQLHGRSVASRKLTHSPIFFPINNTRGAGERQRLCHDNESLRGVSATNVVIRRASRASLAARPRGWIEPRYRSLSRLLVRWQLHNGNGFYHKLSAGWMVDGFRLKTVIGSDRSFGTTALVSISGRRTTRNLHA